MRDDPFSRYSVHGVGIGYKVTAGRQTERLALRFHVACKVPAEQLPPERRIPDSIRVFSSELGREVEVATDIIESPPPTLLAANPEDRLRPVPGGASCSSITYFGAGTIGGWVWDHTDDTIVMLSNQHVFGDTVGGVIIQPGTSDDGQNPQDRIGRVKRSVPIMTYSGRPQPSDCNLVDAAIGEADDSQLFDLTVLNVGPAVYQIGDALEGDAVEKMGQESGHTFGVVTDIDYNSIFTYPEGSAVLCDCLRIVPTDTSQLFSTNGDSGSLIFKQGGQNGFPLAVGLLFGGGGTPPNNWAAASRIGNVFDALDLGPLCEGGCAAFLDALYADQEGGGGIAPARFTLRERGRERAVRFHSGLTGDLQARIMTSVRGRGVVSFITQHRGELLTLMVKDGDTRRAMVAALRPLLVGAITTDDVLARRLTTDDVHRLERLGQVVSGKGSESLQRSIEVLHRLLDGAAGRSLFEILELRA
jgi:hypothetical protein